MPGIPLLNLHGECRQRRGLTSPVGDPPPAPPPPLRAAKLPKSAGLYGGCCLGLGVLSFVIAGLVAVATTPKAAAAVGAYAVPDDATCLRVTRHANHVETALVLGTPPLGFQLLVRLDQIVEATDTTAPLRLFSSKVVESQTARCSNGVCTDVALVQHDGPARGQSRVIVQYQYTNSNTESNNYEYDRPGLTLELDGELSLTTGMDYFLTASHLCWTPAEDEEVYHALAEDAIETFGALRGYAVPTATRLGVVGIVATNTSFVDAAPSLSKSPVAKAYRNKHCPNASLGTSGAMALFPGAAASEAAWLTLTDTGLYDSSPEGVEERRRVVEVGRVCAAAHKEYERALGLYQLDCQFSWANCKDEPSLTFRRVADSEIRIYVSDQSNLIYVWSVPSARLTTLPRLQSHDEANGHAVFRLLLMLLAAAVIWIRAEKAASSNTELLLSTIRSAWCDFAERGDPLHEASIWEDAFIGAVAIGARIYVVVWQWDSLVEDNQLRMLVFQVIGCACSVMHFGARYATIASERADEPADSPLILFGGSTALVDAPSAIMLAFAEAPLLVTSLGRFNPTARLLTSLLLVIVSFQRMLFAAASCGILFTARYNRICNHAHIGKISYLFFLGSACVNWLVQLSALGVLVVDAFVMPLRFSVARGIVGEWAVGGVAIFLAVTLSSMPIFMSMLQDLLEMPVHPPPKPTKKDGAPPRNESFSSRGAAPG